MNKHKYHLAAILIHDGIAGQGHYYSFNRNVANNTWRRFNDINVLPESEQNVMREAIGGYGNTSAYCLVYLSDNMVEEELGSLQYGSASLTPGEYVVEREHYSGLLPVHLVEYVESDNSAFYTQIEEFKFNKYLINAVNIYRDRYNLIERVTRGKSANRLVGLLDSFGTFLKSEPHSERMLKWYLLDTSLKEISGSVQLRDIADPVKLAKIQDKLSLLDKQYIFSNLALSKEEKIDLDVKLAKYMELYPFTVCYKYVIRAFMTKKYVEACYGIRRLLFMSKQHKLCTIKPLMDVIEVVVLRFALECEKLIIHNKLKELIYYSDILLALLKGTLKATDVHSLQVKQILLDGLKDASKRYPQADFMMLNNEVHKVLNPLHTISELEKPIKDYKCEELEEELEKAMFEDLYSWKDLQSNGPSYELGKLLNDFSRAYGLCVGFHHSLKDEKTVYSFEDRDSMRYVAR